ncbi:MAG: hypothetical protein WB767_06075 [Nocardioides sp.]
MSTSLKRAPGVRHLLISLVVAVTGLTLLTSADWVSAQNYRFPAAAPVAECGPGSRPETDVQGRVPAADYESGRATKGYRCNAVEIGRNDSTGGFKVLRYVDRRGQACAYYDTTRVFPSDFLQQTQTGFGVIVLDMDKPSRPRVTTTLTTPTMLSPHESLLVNEKRGLLAAVLGNAFANAGVLEIYDISKNCRQPRLLSRTTEALLGHESGWSPDGKTFYASGSGGQTLAAIDVSNPRAPRMLFSQFYVNYHGMRLSQDGRTMYVANIGNDLSEGRLPGEGLRILDVSEIQDRKPNPRVRLLSNLTWREAGIPQVAQPFTRDGREYLLQVDEFTRYGLNNGGFRVEDAVVGAARLIDVDNPRSPKIVSNLRLEVHQPKERKRSIGDPGANTPVGGYTAHYCSVPYYEEPRIVACSMIGSGLRIFDISDLSAPREVAYFNRPSSGGAGAFSQPAWDVKRRTIWYSDSSAGFFAVRLTNGVGDLLAR